MKILVRSPNWIGDQILAFPFFHYLRETYPDAEIAAVCTEHVKDLQFRNLTDAIYVLPQAVHELRAQRPWDLAYVLPNSFSSAWLAFRSGAKIRRGYKKEGRGLFLNQGLKWDPSPSIHRAQSYLNLLPGPSRDVENFWEEVPAFDFEKAWPDCKPMDPLTEPYWVLAPGSNAESRRWSVESYLSLSEKISKETGWTGVIVGGAEESPLAARLCEGESSNAQLKDYTARGSVSSLWKLFQHSKFTVTNESGLAHLAALSGCTVHVICGAADPRRTCPLGPGKVQVFVNPVECWPCERNHCLQPDELKLQCLKGIHPETVWKDMKVTLATKS